MDRIFIKGLQVVAVIGVFEWEQRISQTLRLDLILAADTRRAADSDALGHTVDYAMVAERLQDLGKASEYALVETFAERCASRVMEEFGVPWVQVSVTKQVALPESCEVGVVIERGCLPLDDVQGEV